MGREQQESWRLLRCDYSNRLEFKLNMEQRESVAEVIDNEHETASWGGAYWD